MIIFWFREESIGLFPGRCGLVLFRAGRHNGRVDVHGDQAAVCAGCGITGQFPGPLPGRGPRAADRLQRCRRVSRQAGDQPGHHRIGGHRAEQLWLRTQHRGIGQAIPAQRQRHRQISDDLPRIVHRTRCPPPFQRR